MYILYICQKNNIEKHQQKTTWDDVGAHSTIPAKHVQSQVARATANNFNICQEEHRRGSNKNCKQTGLQYFPDIPGRFHWLLTSTICLILVFVTSSTLQQVQKTKSFIFLFGHRRLPDLDYPTHPIDPNLFARKAETCAVGKVSGYNLHYQINHIRQKLIAAALDALNPFRGKRLKGKPVYSQQKKWVPFRWVCWSEWPTKLNC